MTSFLEYVLHVLSTGTRNPDMGASLGTPADVYSPSPAAHRITYRYSTPQALLQPARAVTFCS